MRLIIVLLIILGSIPACQSTNVPDLTVIPTPTVALSPQGAEMGMTFVPTQTPRSIEGQPLPAFVTPLNISPSIEPEIVQTGVPPLYEVDEGLLAPQVRGEVVGLSVQERSIESRRYGDPNATQTLMLVGGIHGGYEINTVTLMDEIITHLTANPDAIPTGAAVIVVRAANPDGLEFPEQERGRFNANGVDLNRNWGCNWQSEAFWRSQTVNPGAYPLSEPETSALAAFIEAHSPDAVLFYHSAAGGVFAGDCPTGRGAESDSFALAEIVGNAAGYSSGSPFSAYTVTGAASDWVDSLGIPSADVELFTRTESEFDRNWRAVEAVLVWLMR